MKVLVSWAAGVLLRGDGERKPSLNVTSKRSHPPRSSSLVTQPGCVRTCKPQICIHSWGDTFRTPAADSNQMSAAASTQETRGDPRSENETFKNPPNQHRTNPGATHVNKRDTSLCCLELWKMEEIKMCFCRWFIKTWCLVTEGLNAVKPLSSLDLNLL